MGGAELQRVGVHGKCWTTEGGVHGRCWTTEGGGPWDVALRRTVYYNYQQTAHE